MNTEVMKEYTVKERMERAVKALEVLNVKHEFKPGDVVQWKPWMKNRKFPQYDEPALVAEVLQTLPCDITRGSGAQYFNEPLDLVLARIDEDDGEFMLHHYDSRRFEPYKG